MRPGGPNYVRFIYCVIKCVKTKRVLEGKFASSVFHSCYAKTQKTQICVTGPQCVKRIGFDDAAYSRTSGEGVRLSTVEGGRGGEC
jgi:hypothetical protein